MTERGNSEQPVSVAQIAADDRLLDALGRGEAPDAGLDADPAAAMLAAWRADLDGVELLDDLDDLDDLDTVPVSPTPPPAGDPRRKRRLVQGILGAAAAAVFAVGFAVTAHQAQPGSVLWPVSKVVYPQRAEVLAAENAIADARKALAEGRTADARALLATALEHIGRIDDSATAARLRTEAEALLSAITTASPTTPPAATPTPGPAATTPAPTPRTSRSAPPGGGSGPDPGPSSGGGADPEPQPSQSPDGGILPSLPLPSPLLPLPSISLPPLPPILPDGD